MAAEHGPEAAEVYQAIHFSHNYLDRVHDGDTMQERTMTEALQYSC